MQAIEINTYVNDNHEIRLELPKDVNVKSGRVKVIVMYEEESLFQPEGKRKFGQFKGQATISDDFDDELGDEFWTGTKP